MNRLLTYFLCAVLLCSCTATTAITMINAWKAEPERWTNGSRQVVFIPMVHVSRPEFYQDVQERIEAYQSKGYVVYFEGVKAAHLGDSAADDELQRKIRKMLGFRPGLTTYADMLHNAGIFRDRVNQPQPADLGMSSRDAVVDINAADIVTAYEKKYGAIRLDSVDRAWRIDTAAMLPRNSRLGQKEVMDVLVNTRNEYLAQAIHTAPDAQLVIVYGFAHKKGVLEQLKALDPKWKKR